ncbi:hypothetical protein FQN51_003188 [Onygenales sp. PD_10]|nr:hypothetical protein FQN51_003188 [Onygenales sp. PD_10]
MESQTLFLWPVTNSKQLFVNGKPFLMRAAELQHSSLSSADYMRGIWPRLVGANINTVLGSVTGEQIEPEEGSFDFSEVTKIVQDAREHNLHLVLLWFGSFKNGLSTYAPGWVKKDVKQFPRAILRKEGGRLEVADVLSISHGEAQKADARAFKALMEHLRAIDKAHSTVIMVQVENEVGLLGDSRDGGAAANHCFKSPVPKKIFGIFLQTPILRGKRFSVPLRRRTSYLWLIIQPLFIPEQRRDGYGARRIWAAFGSFQALGAAPFGIDTLELDDNPFRKHYGLLAKVSHHVLEAQRSLAVFDSWKLQIERSFVFGKPGPGFGMVIHKGGASFLLIGEGFQVKFSSTSPKSVFTGILKFVEKEVVNEGTGEMRSLRVLGGDETRSGQAAVMPAENPDYGSFPISITIPANTRIAECEVYALEEEAVHLLN